MSIIQGSAMQGASRGFYPKELTGSLRFNDDDSAYLSWTPASAGNRKTWTWSAWVKRCTLGTYQRPFQASSDSNNRTELTFFPDNTLEFFTTIGGVPKASLKTQAVFRDPSAWYHLVVVLDAVNTSLEIYVNGVLQTLTTTTAVVNTDHMVSSTNVHTLGRYNPTGASYFDGYMAEVFFIDGTAHDADAFGETKNGVWVPKNITATDFTMGTNGFHLTFEDDTEVEAFNTVLYRGQKPTVNSVTGVGFRPSMVWIKERDNTRSHRIYDEVRGAFLEVVPDSTAAEAYSENGLRSFDSDGFTVGNDTSTNANGSDYVAWCWDAGANNASTGHSSVTYTGTGSTSQRISGFPFSPDLLWLKCRGAAENHNLMDTVRGWGKRLKTNATDAEQTFSGGGFYQDGFAPETTSDDQNKNGFEFVAWAWDAGDSDPVSNTTGDITSTVKSNGDFSIISYVGTQTAGDEIGHSLNAAPDFFIVKNREDTSSWIVWHKDLSANQWCKLETTDSVFTNADAFGAVPSSTTITLGTFRSTNGTGEDIICYAWRNVTGKQKFGTYTGDGTTDGSKTITTGFRPGFLMIKKTSSAGGNWVILDGSRDPINNIGSQLYADTSDAEAVESGGRVEFTSTGFKLVSSGGSVNGNSEDYIYAAFAGSYSDYITDYNTDGTNIDSRVKANQTTGFSICSYEGSGTASDSFGHGLGTAPSMVIIKDRELTNSWLVQHSSVTGYLTLNATNAVAGTNQLTFGASTVTLNGTWDIMNGSGRSYIAYCWAEKTGYSKFGSYTGNGSATGPSITCGFKPAMIILKRTDSGGSWTISDNTRDTVNPVTPYLFPHASDAEATDSSNEIDFNSNGFQIKHDTRNNTSGATYIYAAFADTREAAFWLDQSGNDNDWQPNNLDHNDTVSDSPTDNFATLNPLELASGFTLSDGNLTIATTTSGSRSSFGNFAPSSGKYYFEATVNVLSAVADWVNFGVAPVDAQPSQNPQSSGGGISFQDSGRLWVDGTETGSWANDWNVGDTLMCAFDVDTGKVWLGSNGTWGGSGNPTAGTNEAGTFTGLVKPLFGQSSGANRSATLTYNFGQQPFKYSPPE